MLSVVSITLTRASDLLLLPVKFVEGVCVFCLLVIIMNTLKVGVGFEAVSLSSCTHPRSVVAAQVKVLKAVSAHSLEWCCIAAVLSVGLE